jgi:hypothetical protein
VGKAGLIPTDNAAPGIAKRRFVTNDNKAHQLGVSLERIRMSA